MKKVIVITGASAGIGYATAIRLAKAGHIVYGLARSIDKLKSLHQYGVKTIQMDVTKEEERVNAVNQIIQNEGRIDVLFNNAGYGLYGAIEDIPLDDARYQFEVNIFGLAGMTQLVIPHMRKNGSGKIINNSSIGGKVYTVLGAWYHATKHALEGWSDSLRLELKQFNIDVVIIEPGVIYSEFGIVGEQPLAKYSLNGHYKTIASKMIKALRDSYQPSTATPADVIAEVVEKAINSNNPKTRYVAGKYGKLMLFIRHHFSDKFFDKIIMSMLK